MADHFLSELKRYCAAGDFTDQAQFQNFLSQYTDRLNLVREKCDQLNSLLTRNMVTEAAQYYNQQHPSLRDQINELRFAGLQDWLDTADIYGMTVPQPIDDSVLKRLTEEVSGRQGIQGLLAEYRQIASSNDLARKTELARKILEKQPGNPQWSKTLHDLEEKSKQEVMDQAKAAILQHDETALKELYDYLNLSPWETPPRPEVLAKMKRTLHEWRLEALGRQANAVSAEIDRLYCENFEANLESLQRYFQRWDSICASEADFSPAAEAKAHVEEVRGLWNRKTEEHRREAAQRRQFEERRAQLRLVMDNNGTCEELEAAYHALSSVGLGVPAEDEQRYQACHERARLAVTRRRRMSVAIWLVVLVAVGALGVFGWSKFTENKLIDEYVSRVDAILVDSRREATECDAILAEVEQDHPELVSKNKLVQLRHRVATRQEEQREARNQAEAKLVHIQELLANFQSNHQSIQNNLIALKKMTVTSQLQEQIAQLEEEVESRRKTFMAERKREFMRVRLEAEASLGNLEKAATDGDILRCRSVLREISRTLEDFEADLEDNDLEACRKLRKRIQEKISG